MTGEDARAELGRLAELAARAPEGFDHPTSADTGANEATRAIEARIAAAVRAVADRPELAEPAARAMDRTRSLARRVAVLAALHRSLSPATPS